MGRQGLALDMGPPDGCTPMGSWDGWALALGMDGPNGLSGWMCSRQEWALGLNWPSRALLMDEAWAGKDPRDGWTLYKFEHPWTHGIEMPWSGMGTQDG